jgi:hypothetical protein
MGNFKSIFEGWKNHLSPDKYLKDTIDEVSKKRLIICRMCPYHSSKHGTIRPDEHCTDCGCSLLPKTKCLSCSCPQDKWGAEVTKEEQKIISDETNVQD